MAAGTVYAKRYGAGFTDGDNTKQVDAQFLNAVEAALLQLIGAAPTADGQVAQWDNANTRFGPALLLNKNVDPAAAIASSKIDFTGANALTNAAIAGAAAIARSKLNFGSGLVDADIAAAAALGIAKLAGYPADGTKALFGDATWKVPGATIYRKATATAVNTTIAATDLLAGGITIAAGVMGATGKARLTANGDWLQNAAAGVVLPRFQLVLGGTTLIDTGANTRAAGQSATRTMWRLVAEITNTATNAQNVVFLLEIAATGGGTAAFTTFTTGTGIYDTGSTSSGTDMRNYAKGYNTSAVDTTASKALVLNVINGSNSASYETKLFDALVEVI